MKKILLLALVAILMVSLQLNAQDAGAAKNIQFPYDQLKSGEKIKLKKNAIYLLEETVYIFEIQNFTLDGNGATLLMKNKDADVILVENSSGITLKNLKATHVEPQGPIGCTGNVIQVFGSKNVTIVQSDLNGCGIVGIAAYEVENLLVKDNTIHENSTYGIVAQKVSMVLQDNLFEKNGNGNVWISSSLNWPPTDLININTNNDELGLKMSGNKFK